MQELGILTPDETTREGRMLAAGRLTVTVTSARTGEHITISVACKVRTSEGWEKCRFDEASHVYFNVPSSSWADRVGTFYPRTGRFFRDGESDSNPEGNADPARVWAALAVLRLACEGAQHPQASYAVADRCGRCGRALTDPVSIERGIGPECYGYETGSRHETRQWVAPATPAQTQMSFVQREEG
jgi:hypothetical protein